MYEQVLEITAGMEHINTSNKGIMFKKISGTADLTEGTERKLCFMQDQKDSSSMKLCWLKERIMANTPSRGVLYYF